MHKEIGVKIQLFIFLCSPQWPLAHSSLSNVHRVCARRCSKPKGLSQINTIRKKRKCETMQRKEKVARVTLGNPKHRLFFNFQLIAIRCLLPIEFNKWIIQIKWMIFKCIFPSQFPNGSDACTCAMCIQKDDNIKSPASNSLSEPISWPFQRNNPGEMV